ncbi:MULTISPECIES: ion channel [Metabacillus]|uniref:ion channel n=1 Tax=Metabacillus TaxID=2675233 RepID=UPI00068F9C9C|nr:MULTISPECIES: ion channel [Metabacillus]
MFSKYDFTKKKLFLYMILNVLMISLLVIESMFEITASSIIMITLITAVLAVCYYFLFEFIVAVPKTEERLQSIFIGSGLLLMLIITGYANLYFQIYGFYGDKAFKFSGEQLSGNDFLYYSITTFTTTGFGDITSIGVISNAAAASEMLMGFIVSTLFMAVITSKLVTNLK